MPIAMTSIGYSFKIDRSLALASVFFVYRRMRIENVDFQHLTRGINDSQLAAGPKRRIDAEDHFAFQRRLQKQTFNVH